ncbi:MaoC/PaaZ C-terminal domain-containing protein [Salicibibacter cibi]|uniref:MaoC/PaaZ C-terminal domain-containing protein n=1 Tax=Salicibibacter cibi TaxID=2743001 RepID=UPI002483C187|nr:MaoC/PaaZ C-terminal domain-containing protein [Salicibibacter cibi]
MIYEDIDVGEQLPVIEKDPITRVQLVKYAGASGDFNPLHTVEEVGEQASRNRFNRSRDADHGDGCRGCDDMGT